jgi:hypothetical protein
MLESSWIGGQGIIRARRRRARHRGVVDDRPGRAGVRRGGIEVARLMRHPSSRLYRQGSAGPAIPAFDDGIESNRQATSASSQE